MFQKLTKFFHGISVNRPGKTGVFLVVCSFWAYFLFEFLQITGILHNAFIALVSYLTFPTVFFFGIVLIVYGWFSLKKEKGKITGKVLEEYLDKPDLTPGIFGSKFSRTVFLTCIVSILFLMLSTIRMLTYMDQTFFCGTACHTIMNPEWVAYKNSPHARVKCVDCHVGYGLEALVASKINGTRQMILASFNAYNTPIPTPVHQLRPARETCEECHWPSKFYGTKMKKIVHFEKDSASTPVFTTLAIKIDDGKGGEKSGIHWHISDENEVRYVSADDKRKEMLWVEARQKDGSFKRYVNKQYKTDEHSEKDVRVFDCVDCHNRATHVYENPEVAVDNKIRSGHIPIDLPFIKREATSAISPLYPSKEAAMIGIENHIYSFYKKELGGNAAHKLEDLDQAIETLQELYAISIHPNMKVEWGTYPSLIGHTETPGCSRCHNDNLVDSEGIHINNDCTLCHSILANGENEPFKYLKPLKEVEDKDKDKNYKMHQYLQEEFLQNSY